METSKRPSLFSPVIRGVSQAYHFCLPYAVQIFKGIQTHVEAYPRVAVLTATALMPLCWLMAVYAMAGWGFFGKIPSTLELRNQELPQASEVYSSDGVLLGRYFLQNRTDVPLKDLPKDLIYALIATEDARFYSHNGIDHWSIARVLVKRGLLLQRAAGGGSTLDQQLAKNLFPRRKGWFFGDVGSKFREMHIARQLNKAFSKDEILERYLNTVPFSENAFGIHAAALQFFNKPASALQVEESAVLVGLLKATSQYNPRKYPERAQARRNVVLAQMQKYLYLDARAADSLQALPLAIKKRDDPSARGLAPYLLERLRQRLAKWCATQTKPDGAPYNLYQDGLKIYTTLDSRLQTHAERAVDEEMPKIQRFFSRDWQGRNPEQILGKPVVDRLIRSTPAYRRFVDLNLSPSQLDSAIRAKEPRRMFSYEKTQDSISLRDSVLTSTLYMHAGLIAIDPQNGYVRAWVGGIRHDFFQYDQVTASRQAGSVFKPILYATALEQGYPPCTKLSNERIQEEESPKWSPGNADGMYGGSFTLIDALALSVNVVAARLILDIGSEKVAALAKKLGIRSKLDPVPALALGAADVSLQEMTSAYAILANGGRYIEPEYLLKVVDKHGKVLLETPLPEGFGKQILQPMHAAQICYMMIGVGKNGTARSLKTRYGFSMDIACKTGTAQNQTDGWFIGALPGLVTGVRVGGQEQSVHFKSLSAGQGAATAVPIWANFMKRVLKDPAFQTLKKQRFALPDEQAMEELNCPPEDFPIYEDDFMEWYFRQQQSIYLPHLQP